MTRSFELPNELDFEQWYVENAFHYERDPIGSRDCELQRKAWHAALSAIRGEWKAVAYTTRCRLDLLKLKPEKAQTMWGEKLLDEGDIPLYLHHRERTK